MVGGVDGTVTAELDGGGEGRGELQEWREMEQGGWSVLGMPGAGRGVPATRVS